MFRQPKSSNQSPVRKQPNLVVNPTVNTSKNNHGLCKYRHRKCNFVSLDNYDYCLKHILEDKSAPYKPCPFLYTVSGKKCGKPALRQERKDTWFCAEHSRKTLLQRQRAMSRHAPPKTQEALFATLGHYVPPDRPKIKKEDDENDESARGVVKAVDPFLDIDAGEVNSRVGVRALDCVSESDSDVEPAMLDAVWRAQDHESSDAESVDSQAEDPLKHAGTYTAEEVTIIIKDKMLRLQSLYIDQFRRLHHLLKEKRRKYLLTLKKEKETLCSIHDQEKLTAREQKLYQKLKALNRYHKHHGVEAILHKKALELRAQVTEGHQLRTSHKGKCAFTEGGVKCGAKTLPVTKYCRKHILEDTQQVLFRACGVRRDDHVCQEPTLNVFENATCVYHIVLPPQPHDKLAKPDSSETQTSEGDGTQTTQNDSENSFVNVTDSEELLIKEILKPDLSSGKPDSVDPLELSRTVSDILALAEAHSSSTDLSQTSDKPFLDQSLDVTSNNIKPFINQNIEASCTGSINQSVAVTNQSTEPSTSTCSNPVSDQVMEATSETPDAVPTSLCEKMEVEEQPNQAISSKKEDVKQETSDLEMVDIMTDVGVVEEVLEADQLGVGSEEVVGSEQEVVVSEQEVVGAEQEVVGSDQEVIGSEQEVVGSEQEVVGSEQEVVGSKQEVVGSEQEVVGSEQEVVGSEQEVVGSEQEVVGSEQEVVGSDQEVVGSKQEVIPGEEVIHEQEVGGSDQEAERSKQDVVTEQTIGSEQHVTVVRSDQQQEEEKQVETDEQVVESAEEGGMTEQKVEESGQTGCSVSETPSLSQDTKDKFEEPMEVVENENQPENG